jgi:type IV secretory pathway TrbD component
MAAIFVLTPVLTAWIYVMFGIAAFLMAVGLLVSLASSRIEHMEDDERPHPYVVGGKPRW